MRNLSISIYSFGYSAGFVNEKELGETMDLEDLNKLAAKMEVTGVEFPVDRYFSTSGCSGLAAYVADCRGNGMQAAFDFEQINVSQILGFLPTIAACDRWFRVKVSNFYGGNRHRHRTQYEQDVARFHSQMKKLHPALRDAGVRVLIENHQDIVLADVFRLVDEYGEEVVGVNWDIGNSLPSGETPDTFLSKASGLIGNVHLKDYQIFKTADGYAMRRCALGQGVIDFKNILPKLDFNIPLTIELGAWRTRTASINDAHYWSNTRGVSQLEIENFKRYIDSISVEDNSPSEWERGLRGEQMMDLELTQLEMSVKHIKSCI